MLVRPLWGTVPGSERVPYGAQGNLGASKPDRAASLEQDLEGELRGAAAPEHVAGLTEICLGCGELGCFRLAETQVTKLLLPPAEDLVLGISKCERL